MQEGVENEAAYQTNESKDKTRAQGGQKKRMRSGLKEAELWETINPLFPNISLCNLHVLYTHSSFLTESIN